MSQESGEEVVVGKIRRISALQNDKEASLGRSDECMRLKSLQGDAAFKHPKRKRKERCGQRRALRSAGKTGEKSASAKAGGFERRKLVHGDQVTPKGTP